jgi:hypothetical protein
LNNKPEAEQAYDGTGGKAQRPVPHREESKTDEPNRNEAKRTHQRAPDKLLPLVHATSKKALPDPLDRTWQL